MTSSHHLTFDRALVIGIILNLLFVCIETGVGVYAHSLALLSDAGHNLSDVGALAFSLIALRLSRRAETEQFTYGYRKSTVLASLMNSMLLVIAVGAILYESIQRLLHPQPADSLMIIGVACIGILINTVTALLMKQDSNHDLNAKGAYLHLMADALVSVGVVAAGIVMYYTHWLMIDPIMSIIIAGVILQSIWSVLNESIRLSLDAVPQGVSVDAVRALALTIPGVCALEHIHIWAMSTSETALTAHILLEDHIPLDQALDIIAEVKQMIAEHTVIHHSTIEILPPLSPSPQTT
jgi:cobalt-zinc-cadmium efflux system protein